MLLRFAVSVGFKEAEGIILCPEHIPLFCNCVSIHWSDRYNTLSSACSFFLLSLLGSTKRQEWYSVQRMLLHFAVSVGFDEATGIILCPARVPAFFPFCWVRRSDRNNTLTCTCSSVFCLCWVRRSDVNNTSLSILFPASCGFTWPTAFWESWTQCK